MAVTEVMMAHHHKATGRAPGPPDDPANVRIAVVTAPGPEVTLRNEIRLCRAALLYGDAVTLYSPNALMLASVEQLGNATGGERFELLRALYPIVEPDAGPAVFEALDQLMGLRKRQLEGPLTRFRGALAELTASMETAAHDEAFAGELRDLWVEGGTGAAGDPRLIDQHSFLRELIGQVTSARDMAAAGIALAAAKEIHAPDILAFGTAVALPTMRAAWERDKARRAVQGHQFYFLHGVQQRLEQ